MIKVTGWILTAGMLLTGGARAYGQMGFPSGLTGSPTGPTGQAPPEMAERQRMMADRQKAQERLTKESAPELYAFQEKLRAIETKIGAIADRLVREEIGRETARETMLPLVREQQEIQNDPEFLVAQKLANAYFTSPKYREKIGKIMAMAAEKQKRKATP